jgi:Kef-type K+ transport system membrane component KefB
VFVVAGIVMGPMVPSWLEGDAVREDLRLLANLTLALILFIDAAQVDLSVVRYRLQIPLGMLLFGLPAMWHEIPESTYLIIDAGKVETREFVPTTL